MWKYLAILAVLLSLMQTAYPLPGRTTARAGNSGAEANHNGQSENGRSEPLIAAREQGCPPEDPKHTSQIPAQQSHYNVPLTSAPPLTIIAKRKTFLDYVYQWGPWFFGLVLAIAGGLQLWLLRITWRAIQTQADHMERQTAILASSVAAAQKSAIAADMSAKAAMGVAVPFLILEEFRFLPSATQTLVEDLKLPQFRISVKNFGQSPAFLKSYAVEFTCEELPKILTYPSLLHYDPIVAVEPGTSRTLEEDGSLFAGPIPEDDAVAIASGKKTLTIYGCVWYGDVFGPEVHKLLFARYAVEFPGVMWIDCDLGERYRASTAEQNAQKAN